MFNSFNQHVNLRAFDGDADVCTLSLLLCRVPEDMCVQDKLYLYRTPDNTPIAPFKKQMSLPLSCQVIIIAF
ncbi:hypothetical protein ABKN59_004439 [Abortiporus biennis]